MKVVKFGGSSLATADLIKHVCGIVAADPILIHDTRNVATSFPGFVDVAATIGLKIEQVGAAADV